MSKTIHVTLRGSTPLLFNKQLAKPPSKDIEPEKVAAMKLHVDAKGKPVIPKLLLVRALISAGRYVQYHKMRNFTSGKAPNLSSIVTSCIDIVEDEFPITPTTWETDIQSFNAHGGDRITRPTEGSIRPKFPAGWMISFTLQYEIDDQHITEEKVRSLVETAGKKIGLGSYRVENTGWFGKFTIEQWAQPNSFRDLTKKLAKKRA